MPFIYDSMHLKTILAIILFSIILWSAHHLHCMRKILVHNFKSPAKKKKNYNKQFEVCIVVCGGSHRVIKMTWYSNHEYEGIHWLSNYSTHFSTIYWEV